MFNLNNSAKKELLLNICKKHGVEAIKIGNINASYTCIGFVQAYNEEKFAEAFYNNITQFVEALIFLDDGCSDKTPDFFMGDKVLVHLKRPSNSNFNDYSNRSLLFEVANLINTKWLLFLDMDERIEMRYRKTFIKLLKNNYYEHIRFRYVHAWDNPEMFREDYPYSNKGIQYRLKMMQKKTNMRLTYHKALHFELKPYESDLVLKSRILIIHLGNLSKEDRIKRYNTYKKIDPNNESQNCYEHLISKNIQLKKIKKLYKINFVIENKYITKLMNFIVLKVLKF